MWGGGGWLWGPAGALPTWTRVRDTTGGTQAAFGARSPDLAGSPPSSVTAGCRPDNFRNPRHVLEICKRGVLESKRKIRCCDSYRKSSRDTDCSLRRSAGPYCTNMEAKNERRAVYPAVLSTQSVCNATRAPRRAAGCETSQI